jgi:Ca-activated chloride channel homolog
MPRLFASLVVLFSLCMFTSAAEPGSPNIVVSASLSPAGGFSPVTIRKQVEEVRVTFQALDTRRQPVLDLAPGSVSVFDNGVRVPVLSGVRSICDLPLSVALMVDASDSVARDFAAEQQASSAFVRALVRSTDDRVLLVAFRNKIEMSERMTGDVQELASSMKRIKVGGLTALYDALVLTSERISNTDGFASRRAIIVISDGEDTDSHNVLSDAVTAAVRNDVAVYAITLRGKHAQAGTAGEMTLQRIADASGGRAYVLRKPQELAHAMQEIERDLRTQYFVTYRPQGGRPGFHTLRLTSSRDDVTIHAKQGYFFSNRD